MPSQPVPSPVTDSSGQRSSGHRCSIVPPYLLEAMAGGEGDVAQIARRTLQVDATHRQRRAGRPTATPEPGGAATPKPQADDGSGPQRVISDAGGTETLPGTKVRGEGDPVTGDEAADEAYDGLGATWQLYATAYGRDSLDDKGLPLLATVHYGRNYDNAFWDGTQMVFGDGDGQVFNRFTVAVDVIGHELTHGVTELTAGLTYQGQPGALNESVSDVFGSLVRQQLLGQSADEADWLIGAGLFTPQVKGVALRSMKAPGTAYDDPQLGKDPQPATMDGYVETTDDNGGVHINSGIPNHAFYLAATAIGGNAWEKAGQVWYDTLTGSGIAADCDFATFAGLTVAAAEARYAAGSPEATVVRDAWVRVGVLSADGGGSGDSGGSGGSGGQDPTPDPAPTGDSSANAAEVRIRRTGGLAGQVRERTVAVDSLPGADASAWSDLLAGDRLTTLAQQAREGRTIPDSYTYHVACPPQGNEVTLPEHGLPEPVRDLFHRTLAD
ncbi:protealysin inhibitor emfourin [Knoellia koreensis]|uniref:Neutral metalloproteinase n=1 Tax=Knoellia koreensis TaxID=2730921 RepID=A0A849HNC1_9MICO|nr:protealysin inhibitor emfourin [Knoellia sp. DB2414S]NNM48034.1 M4 family metallopeptidase [Knoellia sp. DB2414S]